MERAAGNNEQFGAILYDFSKAYDRVPKHILVKKMIELEIPAYLINIIYDWLTNRQFTVVHRNLRNKTKGAKKWNPARIESECPFMVNIRL